MPKAALSSKEPSLSETSAPVICTPKADSLPASYRLSRAQDRVMCLGSRMCGELPAGAKLRIPILVLMFVVLVGCQMEGSSLGLAR